MLEFHARGDLGLIGTFGDPQTQGSMAIFNGGGAAEEFVAGDPSPWSVVQDWQLRKWTEGLIAR